MLNFPEKQLALCLQSETGRNMEGYQMTDEISVAQTSSVWILQNSLTVSTKSSTNIMECHVLPADLWQIILRIPIILVFV